MLLRYVIRLVAVNFLILRALGSECIVSPWSEWGECFGTCEYAEAVRNRDVLQSPLPESLSTGGTFRKICPILYETKKCAPMSCMQIEDDMPRPTQLMMEEALNSAKNSTFLNKAHDALTDHVQQGTPSLHIEQETSYHDSAEKNTIHSTSVNSLLSMDPENINNVSSEEHPRISSDTLSPPISHEPISHLRRVKVTAGPHGTQDFFLNRLTMDMPLRKMLTPEMEKRLQRRLNISKIHYRDLGTTIAASTAEPQIQEPSVEDILGELEAAGDLSIPWDDKHIRKAIRKNKKLMKALMDAYRFKKFSSKTYSSPAVEKFLPVEQLITEESENTFTMPTTTTSTTEFPTTTTQAQLESSSIQYWKRQNGFVPNTKKHASDITNKLYMTREIVQALSDDVIRRVPVLRMECLENSRCCRVERSVCPDGKRPTMIRRFYRPPGSPICVPYHYPRCSQTEEMDERPIEFAQNCQDLCFAGPEKRISPLLSSDFHH